MKTKQQTMTSTSSQLEARSSDSSQEATTGMATVKFTILLQPLPGPKISPIFPTTNKKINNTNNDDTDDEMMMMMMMIAIMSLTHQFSMTLCPSGARSSWTNKDVRRMVNSTMMMPGVGIGLCTPLILDRKLRLLPPRH